MIVVCVENCNMLCNINFVYYWTDVQFDVLIDTNTMDI